MNYRFIDYFYILGTILFTVYGQLILKWRVGFYGVLPSLFLDKCKFVLTILFDPWVLSGLAAAFVASLCWIAAMTKFELIHAYPFMSLNFVFVFFFGALFLNEPITLYRSIGMGLIVFGTLVVALGDV